MNDSANASTAPVTHPIMFWFLTGLALALFAPCVLLPVWVETERIIERERVAAEMVTQLEHQVARNDARIEALLADPLVSERMLRRELNYRTDGERVVALPTAAELASMEVNVPVEPIAEPEPITLADARPVWMVSLRRWLPAWPWRQLFVEAPNRTFILIMAGGLLAAAFVLYRPRWNEATPTLLNATPGK